jgi:two-component system, NtrC family, response regulator AtoC
MTAPHTTGVDDPDAAPTLNVLVVLGESGVQRHVLPACGRIVIGRAPEADIVIAEASVSRQHAALELGATLAVVDLGSANGTRVRGGRIAGRSELELGAPVQLGSVTVMVMRDRVREPPSVEAGPVIVDPRMRALVQVVARVAAGDLGVLLTGESGTGKEVLAQLIHARSRRAAGPFVAINCAALPEGLVEDELFGHGRGAFTGAIHDRRGLFEEADGGTLFLDEVGELAPGTQAKLLRVLEDRTVRALGGRVPRQVDVRIVAASHRELRAGDAFRLDLYYRLAGIVIDVPPLRERRGDILPLAERFLARAAVATGKLPPGLGPSARAWLLSQAWPGNVRELRNAIDRAVLLCEGSAIDVAHLTGDPFARATPSEASLRDSVADVERARIRAMLDECAGNQSEAARRLGVSRNTLAARIKVHGLRR